MKDVVMKQTHNDTVTKQWYSDGHCYQSVTQWQTLFPQNINTMIKGVSKH
jgi:hypothetical protein